VGRPPIGTIVLLILGVVLYAGMMGSLSDAPHSDAAGRGMAVAFGAIFATLLFIDLGVLLLVAALKGRMSLAGKIGSFFVLPASVVVVWMAAEAWAGRDASAIWIPALLPPLIALYAVRARFAPLRGLMRDLVADLALAAVVAVLIGLPLYRTLFPPLPDPVAEARATEEEKARLEREEQAMRESREREAAQFAALGPNSSMADYMPFIHGNYSREAREGIRRVKSRQADTVALLGAGKLNQLAGLLEYDVDATPEVCRAYGAALGKAAAEVDPKKNSNAIGVALDIERQLPNLQWLVGERCDLGEPLTILEKNLRAAADSSRITKLADEMAKLRSR
jgi:hypothetical protein